MMKAMEQSREERRIARGKATDRAVLSAFGPEYVKTLSESSGTQSPVKSLSEESLLPTKSSSNSPEKTRNSSAS